MHWNNTRLVDPVAHKQEWKVVVKPNFATFFFALVILVVTGIYKPILLFALIPAFAVIGIVWWKLADWALKKKKAETATSAKLQEDGQSQ